MKKKEKKSLDRSVAIWTTNEKPDGDVIEYLTYEYSDEDQMLFIYTDEAKLKDYNSDTSFYNVGQIYTLCLYDGKNIRMFFENFRLTEFDKGKECCELVFSNPRREN